MWIAVVDQTPDGRVAKFLNFDREADARAHVARVSERFPAAFAAEITGGVLDWRVAGDALVLDPPPATRAPNYRDKRKAAYIAELGSVPEFTETVGDVLDDLIREVRALAVAPATPEFAALVAKVDAIKARFPKA